VNPDTIYQKLGELVVSFQWLENLLHQIAWILIDPDWKDDPRKKTADFWFRRLLDFVSERYIAYINTHEIPDAERDKKKFQELIKRCGMIADDRNRIVHSTFVELKAGGELQGLLRSKIKVEIDADRDKTLVFDQERLNEKSFERAMVEIAQVGFDLGLAHRQLIQWHGHIKAKAVGGHGS
jgi:hypothetical protein